MLTRQYFRGSHDAALITIFDSFSQGQSADNRLAAAHITLQNAMHGQLLFHISTNFFPSLLLLRRQVKG